MSALYQHPAIEPAVGMNGGFADPIDLESLARQHGRRLYQFILRKVGNPSEAEDMLQNTYLEALRNLTAFRGDSQPQTWLFGIAVNVVRSHLSRSPERRYGFDDISDHANTIAAGLDPCDTAEQRQIGRLVSRRMTELSSASVSLIDMVCINEMSYEDAARQLDIPIGTVRSRLSRIRADIRQCVPG